MTGNRPTYPLEDVKALVSSGSWVITTSAVQGARGLGLGRADIQECILELQPSCFHKTMASRTLPGTFQDVYKTRFGGHHIYLKVQIGTGGIAVTISFKRDESV